MIIFQIDYSKQEFYEDYEQWRGIRIIPINRNFLLQVSGIGGGKTVFLVNSPGRKFFEFSSVSKIEKYSII